MTLVDEFSSFELFRDFNFLFIPSRANWSGIDHFLDNFTALEINTIKHVHSVRAFHKTGLTSHYRSIDGYHKRDVPWIRRILVLKHLNPVLIFVQTDNQTANIAKMLNRMLMTVLRGWCQHHSVISKVQILNGYSDVDDTLMLVILWWWFLDVCRIIMMVTF